MMADITVTPISSPTQPAFQSEQSFVQRLIEVAITLAADAKSGQPNTFAGTGSNTITLAKFRASVRVENNGAPAGSQARVLVFGLAQNLMNELQTLGQQFNEIARNSITIAAGDAQSGISPVFTGTIMNAYADYNAAPDVPMIFDCQSSGIDAVVPATASSFPGPTSVATIMASFARQMNVGFENNGITVQLANPYFKGNLRDQVQACAAAARINAEVINGVLAIWPKGGSRTAGAGPIPLVSKATGMIGYPTFWMQNGVIVRTLFNPQIAFGGTIRVESSLQKASGTYVVWKIDLVLDSQVPNGKWEASAYCFAPGFAAPIPQAPPA